MLAGEAHFSLGAGKSDALSDGTSLFDFGAHAGASCERTGSAAIEVRHACFEWEQFHETNDQLNAL